MDNQFLEAYIHLEKICGEIFGTNHGVSRYIEEMEKTDLNIQRRIPMWMSNYKKLKELRWKRNQYVHNGRIEYNETDICWLEDFYQQIMNVEDPLALKRKYSVKVIQNSHKMECKYQDYDEFQNINDDSRNPVVLLQIIRLVLAVLTIIFFFIYR